MDWRIKALIQKTLATVPGGVRVNHWLQCTIGALRRYSIDEKIDHANAITRLLTEADVPVAGHWVEVGTGWVPAVPICLSLLGLSRIDTFDVHRHLSRRILLLALDDLGTKLQRLDLAAGRTIDQLARAFEAIPRSAATDEVLAAARIQYHAPSDARQTGLPDNSVDVYVTNAVLEHVPPAVIPEMFAEARRILRPGGCMVHRVDPGDHFRSIDRRITQINFLRYSRRRWRFWGENRISYQNRLRASQYVAMAEQAGFVLGPLHRRVDEGCLAALPSLRLAEPFAGMEREDLCTVLLELVAFKPRTDSAPATGPAER